MLLRTRIIVIVTLAFLATFGGLVLAGLQRERLAEQPYATIAISGTEALWREIVEGATEPMKSLAAELGGDTALQDALASRDPDAIRGAAIGWTRGLIAAAGLSDIQILDADGRILFASSLAAEPLRLLDLGTIRAVLGGERAAGIRQVSADRFRVVVAEPLPIAGATGLVLALAAPIDGALERFAAALDADAFMLNTRGRLIEETRPDVWPGFGLSLPQRVATVTKAEREGRLYSITSVPLADLAAGTAGLLVAARDASASLAAVERLTLLTVAGTVAILIAVLVGLYLYLRASFRPLDRAVAVLGALSKGDTSVDLVRDSDDEIGKIADAVAGLRRDMIAFNDTRRQRELQRRRQERFVRRQMETLAGTLEAGAREEVLSDLRRIVAATAGTLEEAPGTQPLSRLIREDDQLGPLAAVLQQMSGRVVEQHRRLTELVSRLQEALVRETQLASLQQELQIARELQRSVIPVDFPDRAEFSVYGTMESAREVGGDFYDFFDRADGRFAVVIADVSGKGVPAAFFMAICRTLLKAIALFENDPAVCVRQLNELLSAGNDQMMFVTLFFGVFDPRSGELTYVNAGHNPPFTVSARGEVRALEASTDMAVAVMDDLDFTAHGLILDPGDRLVLFTDGVTEAFAPGGEPFGEDRLALILADTARRSPESMARAVVQAVQSFEAGGDRSDDVTLLILERKAAS